MSAKDAKETANGHECWRRKEKRTADERLICVNLQLARYSLARRRVHLRFVCLNLCASREIYLVFAIRLGALDRVASRPRV
jgi:hypothetical protein